MNRNENPHVKQKYGDEMTVYDMTEYDKRRPTDNNETSQMLNSHILNMYNVQVSPPPQHDPLIAKGLETESSTEGHFAAFLDALRIKFLGYTLTGDSETLFHFPQPIHEVV